MRRSAAVVAIAGALLLAVPAAAESAPRRRGFSIEIVEPADGAFVLGRTRIAAAVKTSEPEEVDRVEFLVGEKVVFVDREAPWECFYDFGEEIQSWVIRAVVHRKDGITAGDVTVTRKITISFVEEVNRVLLWATVTDKTGSPVAGVTRDQLRVLEDGVEQEITEFYREDRPITLAILIDTSGSMKDVLDEVHVAAAGFVNSLAEADRALVIDFDDKVFLTEDLTGDKETLRAAVMSTEAIGDTAIYDALHAAFRKLRGIDGRKAIVLLTDGDDTSSQMPLARVLEEARAEGVIIYPIGLGNMSKGPLADFAEATGGRPYFVGKAAELSGVYERIAEELRLQYFVAYSTRNKTWDGRFVKLAVEPLSRDWKVRTREGFYAVKGEGGRPPASR